MDLVEKTGPTHEQPFRKMADDVARNAEVKFGGACVLVPPGDDLPVEMLFLGQDNAALFWAAVKSLCEQKIQEMDAVHRQLGSGLRR